MRTRVRLLTVAGVALTAASTLSPGLRPVSEHRASTTASYRFAAIGPDGLPARWNPCVAHPVFVDLHHAPAGAVADLLAAFHRADAVSGLRFRLVGTTSVERDRSWRSRSAGRPPGAWPPITVQWAPPGKRLALPAKAAVTTTSWITDPRGRDVYVTASITFASAGIGRSVRRAIAEHEIGHLLGLAHVSDPHQMMYPTVGRVSDYGAGDRAGLRRLGHGPCLATPRGSP
jgi:hypothetical protein